MRLYTDASDYPYASQLPSCSFDEPSPPRITLAGNLDPTTGLFYRTPEHPRLRTAQACEKCRTRKAKCSGEHPSCARCLSRGLACEYAKEGRVRGPNMPRSRPGSISRTASNNLDSSVPWLYSSADNAERRRPSPTLATVGGSAKLQPLSSCVPLALPSPPVHNDARLHTPMPLKAAKRSPEFLSPLGCASSSSSTALGSESHAALSSTYCPTSPYTAAYSDSSYADRGWSGDTPFHAASHDGDGYGPYGDPCKYGAIPDGTLPLYDGDPLYDFGRRSASVTNYNERVSGVGVGVPLDKGLAMRRVRRVISLSTNSLWDGSGSTGSGSGNLDGESSPPASDVSSSFPLFRAQWPHSQRSQSRPSTSHVYSPNPHPSSLHSSVSGHSSYSIQSHTAYSLHRPNTQSQPYSPHS